ncbi:MAG: DNA primase [Deltaproteobacteria bacterium]|nr:DNA primase [Deltaproteobacteria bacterium]
MGTSFGDDTVSRIRSMADIVEVVSGRVSLKKAGRSFLGLCPFHSEKTPSFTVNPVKQFFHCFGCGEGGDIFDFVMKSEGLSFPEAVASLGERYGIQVEAYSGGAAKTARSERETLFSANRQAADFFSASLKAPGGAKALEYLEKRGVGQRAVEAFGLGFAPAGWHNLDLYLKNRGVSEKVMDRAGLSSKSETGKTYDRFRDRLMFPITDLRGQITGFGGRTMTDETPKYLNSPQTPVYDKKRVLYGIRQASEAVRRERAIYVVEGYLDVIALWEAGIENAVATCGTALSAEHVRQLKHLADNIVLVFDADRAGISAAVRSLPIFSAEGAQARVLALDPGHDPDTFVRAHGSEAFLILAKNAVDLVQFIINEAVNRHGLSITGKTRTVEELAPSLAMLEDPVARSLYVRHLSQRIGVDEAAILAHVKGSKSQTRRQPDEATAQVEARPAVLEGENYRREKDIIKAMLVSEEFLEEVKASSFIDEFENETLKTIGKTLISLGAEASRSDLMSLFETPQERCLLAEIFAQSVDEPCRNILAGFEKSSIKMRLRRLTAAIIEACERGDEEARLNLTGEQNRLKKSLRFQQ